MKNNTLKKITIILLIVLISLLSFVGIYAKDLNRLKNIMPDYKLGMDFSTIYELRLDIDTSTTTKFYDAEGNEVENLSEESDGITSKEISTNPEEVLTPENFAKVKEIILNRIKMLGLNEYYLRQDENGYIVLQFPESDTLSKYKSVLAQTGKLEVQDGDTGEVLLDSSYAKEIFATTHTDTTDNSITALLVLNLNEEGKAKLEEISKTYVKTTDDEGNEEIKGISVIFDGETIYRTYFGQTVTSGQLPIAIGEASKDNSTILENYQSAVLIAEILKSGTLPITYNISYENEYSSVLKQEAILVIAILTAVLVIALVVLLVLRYDKGLFMSISWVGFISTYFLVLRFTNSVLTMNSIVSIIIICAYDYAFVMNLLCKKNEYKAKPFNEVLKRYSIIGIPLFVVAIAFSFASQIPVSSFGIALFWGVALMVVYNLIITKNLRDEK